MEMETNSNTQPPDNTDRKSWNKTYFLVLFFNAVVILLLYLVSHYLNIQ